MVVTQPISALGSRDLYWEGDKVYSEQQHAEAAETKHER